MKRLAVLDALEEVLVVFFLTGGPALGAAIVLSWLVGLILGLLAVAFRQP